MSKCPQTQIQCSEVEGALTQIESAKADDERNQNPKVAGEKCVSMRKAV